MDEDDVILLPSVTNEHVSSRLENVFGRRAAVHHNALFTML